LVLQRCIESLNDIASASEISPIFFLTEQQEPSSWKKGSSKKGKGKEKVPTSTSYFPLSLLLSLLDSQFFLRNTGMMDSLVALLAIVTRPLVTELSKITQLKDDSERGTMQTVSQVDEARVLELRSVLPGARICVFALRMLD
jgi:E3 ubiquitin-protein ligase HUWE1